MLHVMMFHYWFCLFSFCFRTITLDTQSSMNSHTNTAWIRRIFPIRWNWRHWKRSSNGKYAKSWRSKRVRRNYAKYPPIGNPSVMSTLSSKVPTSNSPISKTNSVNLSPRLSWRKDTAPLQRHLQMAVSLVK